ncbi:MAG: hypothetical protein CYG60_25540 [Actinobacteria bacterium]|nr:MAG: hypothetical protein CYG60_25540 [Actinomycetota bacterium]
MQLMRVFGGVLLAILAGVILTRIVLVDELARIWIINARWFLVWGGALVLGVVAAVAVPRRFEVPVALLGVMAGSAGIVLWFAAYGGTTAISLSDVGTLSYVGYVGRSFLISGLVLGILAGIGAWIVAGIRRRAEENERRAFGGPSEPHYGRPYESYEDRRR